MSMDDTQFEPTDRILLVVNDTVISGTTRLQKYGFLLHQQYDKELSKITGTKPDLRFYDDWKALWYGPFSRNLKEDADACVKKKLVQTRLIDQKRNSYRYEFTVNGRVRWRKILQQFPREVGAVYEKVANLQTIPLERLLEDIYRAYPKYTKHSTIRDRFRQMN